jgi:hypothetical protein
MHAIEANPPHHFKGSLFGFGKALQQVRKPHPQSSLQLFLFISQVIAKLFGHARSVYASKMY